MSYIMSRMDAFNALVAPRKEHRCTWCKLPNTLVRISATFIACSRCFYSICTTHYGMPFSYQVCETCNQSYCLGCGHKCLIEAQIAKLEAEFEHLENLNRERI